jgi:hypothetical protein
MYTASPAASRLGLRMEAAKVLASSSCPVWLMNTCRFRGLAASTGWAGGKTLKPDGGVGSPRAAGVR